ncbi:MAG: hypothetical protein R6V19_02445 [Armatimonadota bacterium]
MYCSNCGYALNDLEKVCPRCKTPVPQDGAKSSGASGGPVDISVDDFDDDSDAGWSAFDQRPAAKQPPQQYAPQQSQQPKPYPPQPAPPGYAQDNTSGMDTTVPPEVQNMGFSWGAFGLTWIWGIGNQVWIAFLGFLIGLVPYLGAIGNLVFYIWLGMNGHELAWKKRRFDSLEQFQSTMRVWNTWGLVMFIASIVLMGAVMIIAISLGVMEEI